MLGVVPIILVELIVLALVTACPMTSMEEACTILLIIYFYRDLGYGGEKESIFTIFASKVFWHGTLLAGRVELIYPGFVSFPLGLLIPGLFIQHPSGVVLLICADILLCTG